MHTFRHAVTKFKFVLFTVTLIVSTFIPMLYSPISTHADTDCGGSTNVKLSGSSWLNGGGVNVCTNGNGNHFCLPITGAPYQSQCSGYGSSGYVWSGDEWQCVEMVNRLYLTKGWTTATWYGNGGGSNSISNSGNLPTTLTAESQGAISYINTGDVVSLNNTNDDAGHAGIFDHTSTSGSTTEYNIINQNAQLNSSMYMDSGSFSNKNAHFTMNAWAGYTIRAIVHHPTPPPPPPQPPLRVGYVDTNGNFKVKESSLTAPWTPEYSGVSQGIVSGSLIGELDTSGTFQVKQPSLDSNWTPEYPNVQQAALSDASGSNLLRIGVITNGIFQVKEGSLSATWTNEYPPAGTPVTGYLSGSRIGVLTSDGTFYVKDGGLTAQWTKEASGVKQGMLSGSLIGEVYPDGSFYVKQGALDAGWTWEYGSVASGMVSDATSNTQLRIGYVDTNGNFKVKEGSLSATWVPEYSGVTQGVLSGDLIGYVDTGGTFQVKQPSLDSGWTWEYGGVASGTLWSPN